MCIVREDQIVVARVNVLQCYHRYRCIDDIQYILRYLRSRDIKSSTKEYITGLLREDWDKFDNVTSPSLPKLQLRVFCDILCS